MNNDAVAKIAILKDSMRCFIYGLLGFLPVIGLPFAIAALWLAGGFASVSDNIGMRQNLTGFGA